MNLLSFLNECVVLRHAFQCKFFHQINLVRVIDMFTLILDSISIEVLMRKYIFHYHKLFDSNRESSRVQQNLALAW